MGRTLLVKRLAFREVRALIFAAVDETAKSASDFLQCPVNPHALVDQVMLDPRYTAENAESVKKHIVNIMDRGRPGYRRHLVFLGLAGNLASAELASA